VAWSQLFGCAESLAIASAVRNADRPGIIITRDARRQHTLELELGFFLADSNDIPVYSLPDWECLPYDQFSPHQDIISERLRILSLLGSLKHGIILVSLPNLMRLLPPVDYVLGYTLALKVGDRLAIDDFRLGLQTFSYYSVSQVAAPGEYAVRGGLIDLFPMGAKAPIRIDLFDDEIDSIRYFNPETQLSTQKTEQVSLLPAREFPMGEEAIKKFRQQFRQQFEGDPAKNLVYSEVSKGNPVAGLEFFFPLFFDQTANLFDYVPDSCLWFLDRDLDEEASRHYADISDRFENTNLDKERRALPPSKLYLSPHDIESFLSNLECIRFADVKGKRSDNLGTATPEELPVNPRAESPYKLLLELLKNSTGRYLLVVETQGRRESLEGILLENDLLATKVGSWSEFYKNSDLDIGILVAVMERGTRLPDANLSIITEGQLYGERVYQRRRRSQKNRDPEAIIKSLADLNIDDPIVHETHGIGRFKGLVTLDIGEHIQEFLLLEYQNDDKLYVPVLALDRVSRYLGGDSTTAPLHRLGSDSWDKAKKKAREKAYDVAAELLEIEALRKSRTGVEMPLPEEEYRDFCERFPYEETPDQEQVINDVIADLGSAAPMDRLICGDVGFGKTEVALRAAFVAVHNQKQVAMLVPTTLLAQQHFESFQDRFADLPVQVALMSRFKSKKEIDRLAESLTTGYPDIVIGTHRLLQKDIQFKNLGLVIIDEEQRFGVRQKEQLKRLRKEVDILTLSATPIPRTLNMAMSGLRGISIIATPPADRLSVKTFVRPFNNALIREAILREIHRGGQVYFLHNEVRTIVHMQEELAELVPEARIGIGHGQMPELQLERIMQDFYHQRINLLLCSTIIESGIDVPSANTIIINRADKFGLSQLHQLRGRVGRSHHQAYAYMLVPDLKSLTADARKRLDAIDALEELGAGFTLASHDLEIRGAGELLGESQSGAVDTVGFTLFTEYLNRAVKELSAAKSNREDIIDEPLRAAEISIGVSALFPEDYVPDVHTRLVLYKRLAGTTSVEELNELKVETVDRFGPLPAPSKRLFTITLLSHRAGLLGVEKINMGESGGQMNFAQKNNVQPEKIIQLLQSNPGTYKMSGPYVLQIRMGMGDFESRVERCDTILSKLASS
jgi:transcription-repair coupling factor (superfamily II helicase)